MLQRLRELLPELPVSVAKRVEDQVRRDWGGDRAYICKVGETERAHRSARDQRILMAHRRGDHEELIARREGIGIRRVRQILSSLRGNRLS